ncbi:hypothetical protein GGR51DRAFT_533796 [Nemania sp. FL0031]|nr:hypothetical protein GGR51DRAFT_533796 [Nemania sp. FL0031]
MSWKAAVVALAFLAPRPALSASNNDSLTTSPTDLSSPNPTFSPVLYTLEVETITPSTGQEVIIVEFGTIIDDAVAPFEDIIWGSVPANPPSIIFDFPRGSNTIDQPANYSTVCSNSTTLFDSPIIFWTCMKLSITNVLLDNHFISLDEESVESTNNYLQFGDIRAFNGLSVLDDISTCISSTCQNTSDSTCNPAVHGNITEAYESNNVTEMLQKLYLGFSNYCDGAGVEPNSDVVGPGVVISFLSQAAVVVTFFLASKIHRAISRYSAWRNWRLNAQTSSTPRTSDPRPSQAQRVLARCFVALQAVMADFQEAQAIFVSVVQIASIWFFSPKKLAENSKSYAEANATTTLALLIPALGLVPVLLGQAILYRSGRYWWYNTILTTVTAGLTWYSVSRPNEPNYAALWAKLKQTNPAPQCGGNPSPMTYCGVYNNNRIYNQANYIYTTAAKIGDDVSPIIDSQLLLNLYLGVIEVAPPFLLAAQLYFWIRSLRYWSRIPEYLKRVSRWSALRDSTKIFLSKIMRLINFFIWFILQLALLISLIFAFSFLLFIFGNQTQLAGGWSYGQLVAALVWIPIGLRLVYYIIFGIEKGVESRLGHKFDVQAKDDNVLLVSEPPTRELHFLPQKSQYMSIPDVNDDLQVPRGSWRGTGPERSNVSF